MLADPEIALAIKVLRERKGLTAKELSEQAGLPSYAVSRIDGGKLRLDFLTAARLAPFLGVTLAEMARTAQTHDPELLGAWRELHSTRSRAAALRAKISD